MHAQVQPYQPPVVQEQPQKRSMLGFGKTGIWNQVAQATNL
jgi:hypothetical protein